MPCARKACGRGHLRLHSEAASGGVELGSEGCWGGGCAASLGEPERCVTRWNRLLQWTKEVVYRSGVFLQSGVGGEDVTSSAAAEAREARGVAAAASVKRTSRGRTALRIMEAGWEESSGANV